MKKGILTDGKARRPTTQWYQSPSPIRNHKSKVRNFTTFGTSVLPRLLAQSYSEFNKSVIAASAIGQFGLGERWLAHGFDCRSPSLLTTNLERVRLMWGN